MVCFYLFNEILKYYLTYKFRTKLKPHNIYVNEKLFAFKNSRKLI